jgi:hypothetical protein
MRRVKTLRAVWWDATSTHPARVRSIGACCPTLCMLRLELCAADLFSLGERNKYWFAKNKLIVHFCDCLCGFLG